MISSKILQDVLRRNNQKITETIKGFHLGQRLNQYIPYKFSENANIDTSLFFTNLPNKRREKKVKIIDKPLPLGPLIIQCKHEKLNHYKGMYYNKFDEVPLACKGWHHRSSKGDFFKILPTTNLHPAFVTSKDLPDTFEGNGVSARVIEQLKKINVTHPTVIQAKSLPKLLEGANVFMSGECGSGKTLAYLIGMIENVLKYKEYISTVTYNAPLAIIVFPTRELAVQVGQLATTLTADLGVNCYTLVGGHARNLMLKPHKIPVDILICTISVVTKCLEANLYSTKFCKHLVIDDADSFLAETSFYHLKKFLSNTKLNFTGLNKTDENTSSTQICFVSAISPSTMMEKLVQLIQLNELETISTPYLHKILLHIPQHFLRIAKPQMPQELLKLAKRNDKCQIPTLIFSNKLSTTDWIGLFLKQSGIQCARINNNASAEERMKNFRDFQSGYVNLISCTSVASLGLHFSRAKQVLNYEFPVSTADYIHRCGRVGRLGQDNCLVVNFISAKHEIPVLKKIELSVRLNAPLDNIGFRQKRKLKEKI